MRKENDEKLRASRTFYNVHVRGVEKPFGIWAETSLEAAIMAIIQIERPGNALFSLAVVGENMEIYQGANAGGFASVSRVAISEKIKLSETVIQDGDGMGR